MKAFDEITEEEFAAYEQARESGNWNMWFSEAQKASGLDNDTYISVPHHYDVLWKKYLQYRPDLVWKVINDEG
jgi:hypothetical protein